jgi:hypothetical protein
MPKTLGTQFGYAFATCVIQIIVFGIDGTHHKSHADYWTGICSCQETRGNDACNRMLPLRSSTRQELTLLCDSMMRGWKHVLHNPRLEKEAEETGGPEGRPRAVSTELRMSSTLNSTQAFTFTSPMDGNFYVGLWVQTPDTEVNFFFNYGRDDPKFWGPAWKVPFERVPPISVIKGHVYRYKIEPVKGRPVPRFDLSTSVQP